MPPTGIHASKRVRAEDVERVKAGYQLDNPTKIETIDNKDGTFDVIATFPDGE